MLLILMVALALTLIVPAIAQDNTMSPPKVLTIIREEVKAGKTLLHEQHEAAWTQAFIRAKYTTPILAVSSVTGPAEDWFLIGYESFAAMEKDTEQFMKNAAVRNVNLTFQPKEADLINESRTITARFRPEMSYKPGVKLGEYKYFSVAIIRFRLGEDVAEYYKALNGARDKSSLDTHVAIYQVNSGMQAGTYISFTPIKSIAQWDDPPNEAYQAALKEIGWSQMVAKGIVNVETRLYAFSPEMSNPTPQMVAANPDFWKPKPVMAKKAAATGEVTPAAKKEAKAPDKK
jgi:hypothetical protein